MIYSLNQFKTNVKNAKTFLGMIAIASLIMGIVLIRLLNYRGSFIYRNMNFLIRYTSSHLLIVNWKHTGIISS